ncbi:MAG TPA: DUF2637 domain-containing protein [Euzebyales bacterium]|nr:DUF2637 domain-containing protein [Euzebyales bacterium]
MERITVWMARVGFLSIAACTFGLSFDAISDVARETGAVDPSLAWIVPLAVDGMIVTATAVLWTESLSGRGWHIFPLLAIVGPAALSMWANIAHASGQSLLAQVLAAVPPAGLILSLELVAWQIRRERHFDDASPRGAEQPRQPGAAMANGARPEAAPVEVAPVPVTTAYARAEAPPASAAAVDGDAVIHVDRDDDTGRITLDIPQENRNTETWSRIIAAVQASGAVPSQRELADELNVPRSRVQRAIDRNRGEWERLRLRVEQAPRAATVGAGSDDV